MSEPLHIPKAQRTRTITKSVLRHPILLTFAVLFVAAAAAYFVIQSIATAGQKIDRGQYQAIYTVGGQLFFGKLQSTDGTYLTLMTPYTAQANASVSGAEQSADTTTLVKVSAQVYGPEDSMAIRADQVVFWQNLREDSKVTRAIKEKETK